MHSIVAQLGYVTGKVSIFSCSRIGLVLLRGRTYSDATSAILLLQTSLSFHGANDLHMSNTTTSDIASNFNKFINSGKLRMEELSPLALYSIYQAATGQAKMLQRNRDVSSVHSYKALIDMLHGYNSRWRQGGKNISYIRFETNTMPLSKTLLARILHKVA